jgi:hypothetical protein
MSLTSAPSRCAIFAILSRNGAERNEPPTAPIVDEMTSHVPHLELWVIEGDRTILWSFSLSFTNLYSLWLHLHSLHG